MHAAQYELAELENTWRWELLKGKTEGTNAMKERESIRIADDRGQEVIAVEGVMLNDLGQMNVRGKLTYEIRVPRRNPPPQTYWVR